MRTEKELMELLDKFSRGECSKEEENLLRAWFIEAGKNKTVQGLSEEEKERMYKAFDGSVAPVVSIKRNTRNLYKVAIAVVIICFVSAGWWIFDRHHSTATEQHPQFVEVSSGSGETRKILLPDSSVVWLNANSRLAYHPDFLQHRELKLEGEALFNVQKNDRSPFRVTTGDSLQTLVLGTQFNIRYHKELTETQVTVLSGKVQVSHPSAPASIWQLTTNLSIRYNNQTRSGSPLTVNALQAGAWTKGEYALQGEGLEAFAYLLQNWYGVKLVHSLPATKQIRLDANFSKKQGREELLQTFCILAGCKFRWIDQNTVELYQSS